MKKNEETLKSRVKCYVASMLALMLLVNCDNNTTISWLGRSGGTVSILNDSLAIISDSRIKQICSGRGKSAGCTNSRHESGLHLVNYRTQKPELWGEISKDYFLAIRSSFQDSSVLIVKESGKKYSFWKAGQSPGSWKDWNWPYACGYPGNLGAVIPWKDDLLLFKNATWDCPNVLFDPASGKASLFVLTDESAWLKECTDFSYLNDKIYCLRLSSTKHLDLIVDNEFKEVLHSDSCGFRHSIYSDKKTVHMFGEYFEVEMECAYESRIYKVDVQENSFDTTFADFTIDGSTYIHHDYEVDYTDKF
ncbi:MAG: hypothetical protein GX801_02000 [Fibrobacter sp.]|nr:hypothetical protein [Fibrobacter sp.]